MKKIAVIFGAKIGDVICTSPLCIALKSKYPDAEIVYITLPQGKEVAKSIPGVDEVIVFDKDGICKNKITFIKETLKIRKKHKFDLALCVNDTFRWALFAWLLGAKRRAGRSGQQREIFLTDVYKAKKEKTKKEDCKKHITDFYLQLLEPLRLFNQTSKTFFNYAQNDVEKISEILKQNNCDGKKIICLSPCAAVQDKDWTVEEAAKFITLVNEKADYKIILTGDKRGKEFAQKVRDLGVTAFVDLTAKITLTEFAALLKSCDKLITADTGSAHIAYALEVPSVVFFFHNIFNLWGPKDLNLHKIIYKEQRNLLKAEEVIEALNIDICASTGS